MVDNVKAFGGRFAPGTGAASSAAADTSQNQEDAAQLTPAYKIGAVARLTGLSTHTLRKWEDRYAVVEPARTEGGDRVYTRDDLRRLALIKDLIDAGQSIGKVARLGTPELESACDELHGPITGTKPPRMVDGQVRVATAGDALPGTLSHQSPRLERLEFVATGRSLDGLCAALKDIGSPAVDVLLLEYPSLQAQHRRDVHDAMRRTNARAAVVVYSFGSRRVISSVRGRNVALLRAPLDAEELQRTMLGLMVDVNAPRTSVSHDLSNGDGEPPEPRFQSETVLSIASRATSIECECPRHLSDLWFSLTAFEEFSRDCEDTAPDDAALHQYLRCTTGRARALIEAALERTARADGLIP